MPVLWVPRDTAGHLSPRSKVRYRTLSYFVGTIGTFARGVVQAFPRCPSPSSATKHGASHPTSPSWRELDICHAVNASRGRLRAVGQDLHSPRRHCRNRASSRTSRSLLRESIRCSPAKYLSRVRNSHFKCRSVAPKRANFGHESSYAVRGRERCRGIRSSFDVRQRFWWGRP
jgi:hypothetical protein